MKKLLLAAGMAVALAAGATSANAAVFVIGPNFGPDGSAGGVYGNTHVTFPTFTSIIQFFLPKAGKLAADITTIGAGSTNIDFTSVKLNGNLFTLDPHAVTEGGNIGFIPVAAGWQTIEVKGTSGKNGSFSGTFAFAPVPETATWGMMLLGTAGMGAVLRRRRVAAVAA
jgi:opacity protein-like surface antigen